MVEVAGENSSPAEGEGTAGSAPGGRDWGGSAGLGDEVVTFSFALALPKQLLYSSSQQHPPRIPSDLRTMGGYFF